MKNSLIFFFLSISFAISSQDKQVYWCSIIDENNIPTLTRKSDQITLKFDNLELNKIFKDYKVNYFKRSFPTSNTYFLQTIFEFEIEDENLIKKLKMNFSNSLINLEKKPEIEFLYLPYDYSTNGGSIFDQEELNYIRAPEAWDLSFGNSNVVLGISESVNITHIDLVGKSDILGGGTGSNFNGHGTGVALFAAANTDNNIGGSAIGFNSFIRSRSGGINAVIQLAQNGVKVVNMSWGSCNLSQSTINIYQLAMQEASDEGTVLVAAAGNGVFSCSSLGAEGYHYPATNKNVISVTASGHKYPLNDPNPGHTNQKDRFEITDSSILTLTYNDSIDIVAPGRQVYAQVGGQPDGTYAVGGGTSYAAPIVVGTIGLMYDVNYCLNKEEIESILKLSSVVIDTIPQNLPYYGKLGAGRLDAYEAVKMANDMAQPFGTVEVKNRILYRPWFYKLDTAPYEIKMINNDVSGGSKLKFRARNNIEIVSGDYTPTTGGYIDLQIDENLQLNDCPPPPSQSSQSSRKIENNSLNNKFSVTPTLVKSDVLIENIQKVENLNTISIYDLFGFKVLEQKGIDKTNLVLDLSKLKQGIYIIKVLNNNKQVVHTQKIIKQ